MVYIQKILLSYNLTINNVLNKVNLNKHRTWIRTFESYLDHFQNIVFSMIKQFRPPIFFAPFIARINNFTYRKIK